MKTSLTRTLMAVALLLGSAAHSNEVDDLKVQQDFDEMLILTAGGSGHAKRVPTPCEPHYIDVVHGQPVRMCGTDPVYSKQPTSFEEYERQNQ